MLAHMKHFCDQCLVLVLSESAACQLRVPVLCASAECQCLVLVLSACPVKSTPTRLLATEAFSVFARFV